MRKFIYPVFLVIILLVCGVSYAANWTRSGDGYIREKEWNGSGPLVFGVLDAPPSNSNSCSTDELTGDRALTFDISVLARSTGDSFDVNKVYVDGVATGETGLFAWFTSWKLHGYPWGVLPQLNVDSSHNWSGMDKISICVGKSTLATENALESIVLWYDGSVITTGSNLPKDSGVGDKADMSKPADALAVANNGVRLRDLNGSGIKTRETEVPNAGKPDFIVDKVRLTTTGGTEQYIYNIGDQVQMKADLKNTGDDDIPGSSYVYTRFYLSKGLKEDSHNTWVRVGTDQTLGSNLDPGETHLEEEGLRLWNQDIVQLGKTYNIVVCTDRTADQNNGTGDWIEKHETNNCSTPAVFTVNGNFNFTASNAALGGGKTSLHAGETFSVNASVHNTGGNSPQEMRVGYLLSGGTMPSEVLLGTKIVAEAEFAAGASKSVTLDGMIAPTTPGTYVLDVCMDYDERTQETSETDNCSSFSFAVSAAYDPSPKKASPAVFTILFND